MESITEHRPVPNPIVYGYLRLPICRPARRAALTAALAGDCDRHELVLACVFTDHDDDQKLTPAFAGLMDALGITGSYGVVLPSIVHLGAGRTARKRSVQIAETGRRLMLVRGNLDQAAG